MSEQDIPKCGYCRTQYLTEPFERETGICELCHEKDQSRTFGKPARHHKGGR